MFSNTRLSCWLCPVSLFQSQTEPFSHPIAHRDSLLGWRAKTVMTCLGENTCRDSVIFPRSHLYSSAFTTHVSSVSRRGCHSTCLAPYAENFRRCLSAPVATSYTSIASLSPPAATSRPRLANATASNPPNALRNPHFKAGADQSETSRTRQRPSEPTTAS